MGSDQLPTGSQERVLRALARCGVELLSPKRGAGSHRFVQHKGRPSVVQAGHLERYVIRRTLRQLDITEEEFIAAWR